MSRGNIGRSARIPPLKILLCRDRGWGAGLAGHSSRLTSRRASRRLRVSARGRRGLASAGPLRFRAPRPGSRHHRPGGRARVATVGRSGYRGNRGASSLWAATVSRRHFQTALVPEPLGAAGGASEDCGSPGRCAAPESGDGNGGEARPGGRGRRGPGGVAGPPGRFPEGGSGGGRRGDRTAGPSRCLSVLLDGKMSWPGERWLHLPG